METLGNFVKLQQDCRCIKQYDIKVCVSTMHQKADLLNMSFSFKVILDVYPWTLL